MHFRKTIVSIFSLAILVAGQSSAYAQGREDRFQEREQKREQKREHARGNRPYLPAPDDPAFRQAMRERHECKHDCMSKEDRRTLRRDINDAGRELYRPPPRER